MSPLRLWGRFPPSPLGGVKTPPLLCEEVWRLFYRKGNYLNKLVSQRAERPDPSRGVEGGLGPGQQEPCARQRRLQKCGQVWPKGGALALPCKHLLSRGLQSVECQGHLGGRGVGALGCLSGRPTSNSQGEARTQHLATSDTYWPENPGKGKRPGKRWREGGAWLDFVARGSGT